MATIMGDGNFNVLVGTSGDDSISGFAGTDVLSGMAGNDTLDGGVGADTMVGGTGNDTYIVDDSGDLVVENSGEGTDTVMSALSAYTLPANVENLTYIGFGLFAGTGNSLDNVLIGGSVGNDTLTGLDGNDTLIGGIGADSMVGGTGNDTYIVDNAGDAVMENPGEGTDTVLTTLAAYTLGANVENLTFMSSGNFIGTGNSLDNALTGGAGNDTLIGLGGNDTLVDGGGADSMVGGTGNDTYVVDNAGDVVSENPGEGTDTVATTLGAYTLGANLENLTFTGSGNFIGTGNTLDNALTGGAGNDTLIGLDGNDTLVDGGGADSMVGGTGNDTYVVNNAADVVSENPGEGTDTVLTTLGAYTLGANLENLSFTGVGNFIGTGNTLDNVLTGGAGNDTLYGGSGNDTLIGGAGNNSLDGGAGINAADYSTAPAAISIDLTAGSGSNGYGGTDTLHNIENVIGTAYNDVIIGDGSDNTYTYTGGVDTFIGNGGSDTLDLSGMTSAIWFGIDATGAGAWTKDNVDLSQGTWRHLVHTDSVENVIGTAYNDVIIGDGSDNTYTYTGGVDTFIGNGGSDTLDLSGMTSAIWFGIDATGAGAWTKDNVDLSQGTWRQLVHTDSVENVIGTAYNDVIIGDGSDNTYTYTGGVDTFIGNGGSDTLDLSGMTSAIWFGIDATGAGAWTKDNVDLSQGTWRQLVHTDSVENVIGTAYNDVIIGDGSDNTYTYTGGLDTFIGNGGSDTLDLSRMTSAIWFGIDASGAGAWTKDNVDLSQGTWRQLVHTDSVENVIGTAYNDEIIGDASDNTYTYTGGLDTFIGNGGSDTLDLSRMTSAIWFGIDASGAGAWTKDNVDLSQGTWRQLVHTDSVENVIGTAYNDEIIGDAGSNRIAGGHGNDILAGLGGSDTFVFNVGDGNDKILDFTASGASQDTLDLLGFGFTTAASALSHATQIGLDTVFDFGGGDTVTLVNVHMADLHDSDFLFT